MMRGARKTPPPLLEGAVVDALVEALPLGPDAVARADGYVLFVPGGVPGETVRVRVTEAGRRYGRGEVLEVIQRSPDRAEPFCPYFLTCGGCHLQHLEEGARRRAKRSLLSRTLEHALGHEVRVLPIEETPVRGYREKIALTLAPAGARGIAAGFYRARSRELIAIEECPVQAEPATSLAFGLVDVLRRVGARAWDERHDRGDVRHLVIRRGAGTGELYAVLVARHEELPWLSRFVEEARALGPVGIALNVSPPRERDLVLGAKTRVLFGPPRYRTTVAGLTYHVSPTSFFQTNAAGAESVVASVLRFLGPLEGRRVLDVYGGVGLVALQAARRGARALVVEGNPASIQDGRETAHANGIACSFRRGRAEDLLPRLARESSRFSAVVLDPPREGCHPRVLEAVRDLEPREVAYVSCDPESLGRDLGVLERSGFSLQEVVPVDMFPHAYHIEAVAHLSR
ncbi:23S rRNA (uracil(1939)-C(5))-methyltransferase RlmD [bacterium]|nr:23S rRNA (uracil(1939)-C(5))-methyltransferase RlmD [bacterium]